MVLRDYIQEQYPIKGIIERYASDPYTRIMNADCLPYDRICMYDGKLQKVVEVSDEEVIPVLDVLSWEESDLEGCSQEYKDIYHAYMDNVVLESLDVQEIINLSKSYKQSKEKKLKRL